MVCRFRSGGSLWLLLSVSAGSGACTLNVLPDHPMSTNAEESIGTSQSALKAPARTADGRTHDEFVKVKDKEFVVSHHPYHFVGANFWQAMNLASRGPGGNRAQLLRELDNLKAKGITNLRISAASEGPDTEPLRAVPALMKSPGVYDADLWDGLDFLLKEMGARGMKAVMVLGNMWHWSGGFGQYLVWAKVADSIPYPPPRENGSWEEYQKFSAQFYGNAQAVGYYFDHIRTIVQRSNTYTGKLYRDDPAIMAWELANEPRGIDKVEDMHKWMAETSSLIKSLDHHHLVTTGSEGDTGDPKASGTDFYADHDFPHIDYATAHVWIQNWGWYEPKTPEDATVGYAAALDRAKGYIDSHVARSVLLNKPLVFEEFGIARDDNSFDPASTVQWRDRYYGEIFDYLFAYAQARVVSGTNFWAWSGESRPVPPYGLWWNPGDPLLGDPPHELQGWYGVYDTDSSTLEVISKYAGKMARLAR